MTSQISPEMARFRIESLYYQINKQMKLITKKK